MKIAKQISFTLATGFFALTANVAGAADKEKCLSAIKQSGAALSADEWSVLEKKEKEAVLYCKGALGDASISEFLALQAYAELKLKRPTDALTTLNTCLDINFASTGCHLRKIEALKDLGRKDEARKVLSGVGKIIDNNIASVKREMADQQTAVDRRLSEARLDSYLVDKKMAGEYAKELGVVAPSSNSGDGKGPAGPSPSSWTPPKKETLRWSQAKAYCESLKNGSHLPTLNEIRSLYLSGATKEWTNRGDTWTQDSLKGGDGTTHLAYDTDSGGFGDGYENAQNFENSRFLVACVR